jgi:hypothetical protein
MLNYLNHHVQIHVKRRITSINSRVKKKEEEEENNRMSEKFDLKY